MKPIAWLAPSKCLGLLLVSVVPCVLAAPGEDPVTLQGKVSYLQMPAPGMTPSGDILHRNGAPDDARAKIAKYVAKAYSADTGTVQTDKNVVSVNRTSAGRTTCVQTVGSGVAPQPGQDQVVVIRGDLINICR